MLSFVTPHLRIDGVKELSAERLASLRRKGLLLDVDGTLKDHGAAVIPEQITDWIRSLRSDGLRLCLLSNGKSHRIGSLAEGLNIPFVAKAFKPLPYGCRKALRMLELEPNEVAIVGDQLFADILAGRLAKILTVLVRPTSPIEPWWTRLKRPLERVALRCISVPQYGFGDESATTRESVVVRQHS